MWTYRQASGVLAHDGLIVGTGYSGSPAGRNRPDLQNVRDVGPIPAGRYTIGDPEYVLVAGPHGPFVLPLTPDPANEMFGRAGFLIHGDEIEHPGCASKGCIVMPRDVREKIAAIGEHILEVAA